MMIKRLLHGFLVAMFFLGCVSCSKTDDKEKQVVDPILGVWYTQSGDRVEFFEDNTFINDDGKGGFSAKWIMLSDGRYKMDISELGRTMTQVFSADFSDSEKLTISSESGISKTWTRKATVRIRKQRIGEAISNARQLFFLMVEFDQDFAAFPNDDTAKDDLKEYTGKYSNDYLGQFIAGGYTKEEAIFFVEGASKTRKKPDNDISTKARTLEAGECGFTYVKGQSTSDNSGRPLLCAPMTGNGTKFDPELFGGKAIVLRIDGAVRQCRINEEGEALIGGGKTLFQTGSSTAWGMDGFKQEMLVFPK